MSKWSDPEEWSRLLNEQSCKGRMRLDLILLHPRTADRPYIAAGQEDREPVRSIGTAMNRLMEKAGILFRMLSRAAGVVGCVLLALALGIGAHGAALESFYTSPVSQFSSYLHGEEICPSEDANLAVAERDPPFDSGASTSSDRQAFDVKDLVGFLSHRPVIISTPGELACWVFMQ